MEHDSGLTSWIEHWRGPLIGFLASLGAPWRDATELAQDTFAEAWFARSRFRGDLEDLDEAGAWLRGIAFRLYQNWRRKRERERGWKVLGTQGTGNEPASPGTPEEDEHAARLREAIDRLPSKERTVVWMHYLEETDVERVAALLGTSARAVEGRLYRARKQLRERLGARAERAE